VLRESGLAELVRDRGREAGISGRLHPHQFRHAYAHNMLSAGMQETDLMAVARPFVVGQPPTWRRGRACGRAERGLRLTYAFPDSAAPRAGEHRRPCRTRRLGADRPRPVRLHAPQRDALAAGVRRLEDEIAAAARDETPAGCMSRRRSFLGRPNSCPPQEATRSSTLDASPAIGRTDRHGTEMRVPP